MMTSVQIRHALDLLAQEIAEHEGEPTTYEDLWEMGYDFYVLDEKTMLADDGMRDPMVFHLDWNGGTWTSPEELSRMEFERSLARETGGDR